MIHPRPGALAPPGAARGRVPPNALNYLLLLAPVLSALLLDLVGIGDRARVAIQVPVYSLCVFGLMWIVLSRKQYVADIGWIFLIAAHTVWFAAPALYQLVAPGLWFGDWMNMDVPDEALVKAGRLIALFLAASGCAYFVVKSRPRRSSGPIVPTGFLIPSTHRPVLVVLLFLVGLVPYFVYGGSIFDIVQGILAGRSDKAWAAGVGSLYEVTGQMTIFWVSRAFLIAGAVLAGVYALLSRPRLPILRPMFGAIALLTLIIIYYDQGTRSYLAMAAVPIIAVYVFRKAFAGSGFRMSRIVALGVAVSIALLVVTQLQHMYRMEYSRERMTEVKLGDLVSPQQHIDFYTETANAVIVRDEYLQEPLRESALFYFVVNPIPRVFWRNKPIAMTQWHFTLYRWGVDIFDRGGNALPSVVGQYYMSFGTLGAVWIGMLFGLFIGWLERLFGRTSPYYEEVLVVASALTFIFLSFRYFAPSFHYTTVLLFGIVLFYQRIIRRAVRPRPRSLSARVPVDLPG